MSLVWFCKNCEALEPVESTGDPDEEYAAGDTEKCIDCGSFCKIYDEADLAELRKDWAKNLMNP